MRTYKVIYWLLVPVLEVAIVSFPIYTLIKDPTQYLESDVTWVLAILSLSRTVLVSLVLGVALFRMQLEMRSSYRWLMREYMWRVICMGTTLLLSLAMAIWVDILSIKEVQDPEAALRSSDEQAAVYHWVEFFANMAPGIAILCAFPTKDMFTEFNKYPE